MTTKEKSPEFAEDVESQPSSSENDMIELNDYDHVLNSKMILINNALDEIGFTRYHFKLFCLNGFGYATDAQLGYIQPTVSAFTRKQFLQSFPSDGESLIVGLLLGALIWGFSADLLGRKLAFNTSLLLSSIFSFLAGTMGNWGTYCLFVGLSSLAFGGNLVLDTTLFIEFLPPRQSWIVTFLAIWWGLGQTIATIIGWKMLVYSSCDLTKDYCDPSENRGWRYTYFINAAIVFVLSILRIFVMKLKETPKYLVVDGRDEEAVKVLQELANEYNKPFSLTLEQLRSCGDISSIEKTPYSWINRIKQHLKILFQNIKVSKSTGLIYLSWTLLGLAYPLYSNFLPSYLSSRGAKISASTTNGQYRDNVFPNIAIMGGPLIAGLILYLFPKSVGHRGTLAIGGICSMGCFFGFTQIKTRSQNIFMSCMVSIFLNLYYGCLYAYTPSVMPCAARATGNSIAFGLTRTVGCAVPVIGYFADSSSSVPIWICGTAVGIVGCIALFFPFEPSKTRLV